VRRYLIYFTTLMLMPVLAFSRPPAVEYFTSENGSVLNYSLTSQRISDKSILDGRYISIARLSLNTSNMTLQLSVRLKDKIPPANVDSLSGVSCDLIYPTIMAAMEMSLHKSNTAGKTSPTKSGSTYPKVVTDSIPIQNISWLPVKLEQNDSAIVITCGGNYY